MKQMSILAGVFCYEFRMQIRRPAVWITMTLLVCLFIAIFSRAPSAGIKAGNALISHVAQSSPLTLLAYWTFLLNRLLPIGIGVLQADRLPRDKRTRFEELLTSFPNALSTRLIGKYLGCMLATLVPVFAFYLIGVGYFTILTGNLALLPLSLATFAAITLPGVLFISAFSLACPAILWVPLYQFCFVGYWFWGNQLSPQTGIPTISQTILTPIGGFMARGFFGLDQGIVTVTPLQGLESMLLLIAVAVLVLWMLWAGTKWHLARA